MDPGSFVGKLIGVTIAIWFLFYRKRKMSNPKKWGLSSMFALLFLLAMFGLGALIQIGF